MCYTGARGFQGLRLDTRCIMLHIGNTFADDDEYDDEGDYASSDDASDADEHDGR